MALEFVAAAGLVALAGAEVLPLPRHGPTSSQPGWAFSSMLGVALLYGRYGQGELRISALRLIREPLPHLVGLTSGFRLEQIEQISW